jgi:hypothetical protein
MNHPTRLLAILLVTVCCTIPAFAQEAKPTPAQKVASTGGFSVHETFSVVLGAGRGGNRVTIIYGRPTSKDPKTGEMRKIWGELVPWGKWWRAGSDEATLIITQKPITLGGAAVPAGAHTLFLLPNEDGTAKLIINNQIGQWGLQYDEKQDLARVDATKSATDKQVDQFTMTIDKVGGGGTLNLIWENTKYSVAIGMP